jgi:hypothetical protein
MAVSLSDLLQSYKDKRKAAAEKTSWEWFLNNAKSIRNVAGKQGKTAQPTDVLQDKAIKAAPKAAFTASKGTGSILGKMIMFQYDPKGKATLPYYDMYPVGFPIEIYSDGYLMLNLHYLPPVLRATLMDNLYSFMQNKNEISEKSRLNITYKLLSESARVALFKPCVKRYLYGHVKSQWKVINPEYWDMAMMLPLQRFSKASQNVVWADSNKQMRGKL